MSTARFARTNEATANRFRKLAAWWREETALAASALETCTHPAYQQIIGMGQAAVPLILEDLKSEPDHWFWALKAITGQDPVPPEHRGDIRAMSADWLDWGAKRNCFA